jgi:hypothetical protein
MTAVQRAFSHNVRDPIFKGQGVGWTNRHTVAAAGALRGFDNDNWFSRHAMFVPEIKRKWKPRATLFLASEIFLGKQCISMR